MSLRQKALHDSLYRFIFIIVAVVKEYAAYTVEVYRGSGMCIEPISMEVIDED